jgi:hypothetical protein
MKYEPVPEHIEEILQQLRKEHFPSLANAKILLLARKKKEVRRGLLRLGSIYRPSELNRYLSREEAPDDGYDYIVAVDGKLLQHGEEKDIIRVLRHELRHTFFDADSSKPYKLVDHDFQDFIAEVELNQDDPAWGQRVARTIGLIYEQEADNR